MATQHTIVCPDCEMYSRILIMSHECYSAVIYVNFSKALYSAKEEDGIMIITLEADGLSAWPYSVEVTPLEIGGSGVYTYLDCFYHNCT